MAGTANLMRQAAPEGSTSGAADECSRARSSRRRVANGEGASTTNAHKRWGRTEAKENQLASTRRAPAPRLWRARAPRRPVLGPGHPGQRRFLGPTFCRRIGTLHDEF